MLLNTRKKLESKRRKHFLAVGILDVLYAAIWTQIADLTLAEGKKVEGTLQVILAGAFAVLGIRHIKEHK